MLSSIRLLFARCQCRSEQFRWSVDRNEGLGTQPNGRVRNHVQAAFALGAVTPVADFVAVLLKYSAAAPVPEPNLMLAPQSFSAISAANRALPTIPSSSEPRCPMR